MVPQVENGVLRFIDLEASVISSMTSDKEIQGGALTPNPKRGISYPLGNLIFEVIVAAIFHIIQKLRREGGRGPFYVQEFGFNAGR